MSRLGEPLDSILHDMQGSPGPISGYRRCVLRSNTERQSVFAPSRGLSELHHYLKADMTEDFYGWAPHGFLKWHVLNTPRPWAASNFNSENRSYFEWLDPEEMWHE